MLIIDWGYAVKTRTSVLLRGTLHYASLRILRIIVRENVQLNELRITPKRRDDVVSALFSFIMLTQRYDERVLSTYNAADTLAYWENRITSPLLEPYYNAALKRNYEKLKELGDLLC